MRVTTAFTLVAFSALCASAEAAPVSLEQVVRPRGLLELGEIMQSVSFLYDYSGQQQSGSAATRAHHLQEKYDISTQAALLDPDLMFLSLSAGLLFDQSYATQSASAKGVDYQYSVAGAGFNKSRTPINFLSSHTTNEVITAFIPSYTTTTDSNTFGIRLLSKVLPLNARYSRTSLEMSGQGQNSNTTTNSFMLQGTNQLGDRSSTSFTFNYTDSDSNTAGQQVLTTRGYSLSLSNTTALDRMSRYTLASNLQSQDSVQNSIPQRGFDFTENLNARFGQALVGNATYEYNYNKTLGFNNQEQVLSYQSAAAGLSHTLYRSLETRVAGRYRVNDLLGGNEVDYGGTVGFNYKKQLPAESQLTLGWSDDYSVVDRNTQQNTLLFRDELHRGVNQGELIVLSRTGLASAASVIVTSRNPDTTYQEFRDYTVDTVLGSIQILQGGTIVPGTDLYITYTSLINPMVKYSTDTRNYNGTLSLFRNTYRITGDYTVQNQHLISGDASTVSLLNSRYGRLRVEANYDRHWFETEYGLLDTGITKYRYLEGGWRYTRNFYLSTISLNLKDRYIWHQATAGSQPFNENTFDAGSSYSRSILSWARLVLSLNYLNDSSNGISRSYAFFRADLQGHLNLLQFGLSGQTIWRSFNGQNSRDDTVHLELSRPF